MMYKTKMYNELSNKYAAKARQKQQTTESPTAPYKTGKN